MAKVLPESLPRCKAGASPSLEATCVLPVPPNFSSQSTYDSEENVSSVPSLRLSLESQSDFLHIDDLEPWVPQRYELVKTTRRSNSVQAQLEVHRDLATGELVCVKRFSRSRLCESSAAFRQQRPGDLENPWQELRQARRLGTSGALGHLGLCPCRGAFRNAAREAIIVSRWMAQGDLFTYISELGEPGPQREAVTWPVLRALLARVLSLHELGTAHCDLSVENVLLCSGASGAIDLTLIDFAMAVEGEDAQATRGLRGKPIYRPPEVYGGAAYDAFAADLFACGVMAYALVIGRYPWTSTVPGECLAFKFAMQHGLPAFLAKRRVPEKPGARAIDCISPGLVGIISQLLSPDPQARQDGALAVFGFH